VKGRRRGFTLVEMMVVMAIIVTVLAIAVPFFSNAIVRAKESVLQSNLFTIRSVIDQYTYDKEQPPQGLQDLVDEGYLRDIPVDPITQSRDSWQEITATGPSTQSGLFDVKSGSDKTSLNGTPYSEW
jgi:general secretion pathway protein G